MSETRRDDESPQRFPTTMWSLVGAVKHWRSLPDGGEANLFAQHYWRPVFYFIRAKGYRLEQAEDLTQEFFLRLLDRDWIARADPARGRFRNFLLTILNRFLADQSGTRAPKQRQFDHHLVPISTLVRDEDRTFEPTVNETPEELFMRQWAKAVVGKAQADLAAWCRSQGRAAWYDIFAAVHSPPTGEPPLTQQAAAARFGVTRDQVRYALEQTAQRFVELLAAEVSDQVESPAEIQSELNDLNRLLAGGE
jgi:RNA polymerase sigma-70 factor (ECF subfamily)